MIWYRYAPPAAVLFLPFFVLLAFGASLGVGLWIAALMVEYRDFRFIVPFIVQFGLYISPVGFQSSVVPRAVSPPIRAQSDGGSHRWFPLVPVGRTKQHLLAGLAVAVIDVIVLVASGIWYFRRTEQTFADVI